MRQAKINLALDKHAWHPSPLAGQVVLVTTRNADGQSNIAPKSWVSMMAFDPPVLALGCNLGHVTAQNILRQGEFVVNVPGAELAGHTWQISSLPHPRPVEAAGLTPIPAQIVSPPVVEECKAHLECRLVKQVDFGAEVVFFGEILAVSIDADVARSPDPYHALQMFFFLENGRYGVIEREVSLSGE